MNELTLADIVITTAINLACWYLGYRRGLHTAAMRITRMLINDPKEIDRMVVAARRDIEQLEKTESSEKLKVERHGHQLYIYTEDGGEFLAQGNTLEECLSLIEKRFPDRSFQGLISKEQVDQLGITVNK